MICPKCNRMTKVRMVRGRDENITVRQYECARCSLILPTTETAGAPWRKLHYRPRKNILPV